MSLSTSDLSVGYQRDVAVLHRLNLDFSRGQVTAILGANGCGKSTLFMTLLGILKPQSGEVRWQGRPIGYGKKELRALRQRVSMVFQDPDQQIFYTDVESDIAFALRNLGMSEAVIASRIEQALALVDGTALKAMPVQYLSHGQKKRVAIAGALVLEADMLLLDEPTAGLDPAGRSQMMALIRRISESGRRVVVSSHDIDFIYEVCDYLYVLSKGHLLAEGTRREVFLQPDMLSRAGLVQPWLVRLHQELGYPLYESEQAFFDSARHAHGKQHKEAV
ncbi:cobalt/nickel transport system ATP-binding protein [Aeromonas sp. RU39B]|uniref:ATP-binding cassette domain-containing protein n=1 Tax=Aeromonas sp. RU39B TaxID=1907416 RepID=UPI000954562D|nr:ATP-binding cassette domain-containing protein [Aeromonas sp. RU39B]SIP98602.1 cobalt/nickel transport system ATP-binding protein [Aeromonas sp. RU39B]